MKKIIILTSGNADSTEKIVSLFNEGNRIHTHLVITDKDDSDFARRLKEAGCESIYVPEEEWDERKEKIIRLIEEIKPHIIVLDNWEKPVPEDLASIARYHVVMVTSREEAPKQVVNALESIEMPSKKPLTEEPREKTPDEEWAESLQIKFEPPKINPTPPPLPPEGEYGPGLAVPPINPENSNYPNSGYQNSGNPFQQNPGQQYQGNLNQQYQGQNEPMPATYMIWSILCTIFCCFIPGIIAIIFSSQVSSKYFAGDIEGARRSSRIAEIWIIVSFILGVLTATLYLPIMLLG